MNKTAGVTLGGATAGSNINTTSWAKENAARSRNQQASDMYSAAKKKKASTGVAATPHVNPARPNPVKRNSTPRNMTVGRDVPSSPASTAPRRKSIPSAPSSSPKGRRGDFDGTVRKVAPVANRKASLPSAPAASPKYKAGTPRKTIPASPKPTVGKSAPKAVPRPQSAPMRAPPRPASLVYENVVPRGNNTSSPTPPDAKHQKARTASPMPPMTRKKSSRTAPRRLSNQSTDRKNGLQPPGLNRTKSAYDDGTPVSTPPNQMQELVARTLSLIDDTKDRLLGDRTQEQVPLARKASITPTSPPEKLPPPPTRTPSFVPGTAHFGTRNSSNHSRTTDSHYYGTDDIITASERASEAAAFPDDARWQRALRFVRLLPATPDEAPIKRRIRIFIWSSLLLDFICCIVAITTYSTITTCCGRSIWNVAGNIDWNKAIKVMSVIYILGIFLEIVPVLRGGIPWNIFNPMFGFLISFAVFFDNGRNEAIIMWVIEVFAVFFDYLVYRSKYVVYRDKKIKLDEIEAKLEPYIVASRQSAAMGVDSSVHTYPVDEEETTTNYRETRLLRDRRGLRISVLVERKHLRFHLVGVIVNSVLIFITLMVVVFIARSGGLCISDYETPNPFATDQFAKCPACQGTTGRCEICSGETAQCYYPYS